MPCQGRKRFIRRNFHWQRCKRNRCHPIVDGERDRTACTEAARNWRHFRCPGQRHVNWKGKTLGCDCAEDRLDIMFSWAKLNVSQQQVRQRHCGERTNSVQIVNYVGLSADYKAKEATSFSLIGKTAQLTSKTMPRKVTHTKRSSTDGEALESIASAVKRAWKIFLAGAGLCINSDQRYL